LFGLGLEVWRGDERLGGIENLDLYVNDDPTGTLQDVESARGGPLRIVGIFNERDNNQQVCVWDAEIDPNGHITARQEATVRRGYGQPAGLAEILEGQPPTIYFLDGTTTIGALRYDSRASTGPS